MSSYLKFKYRISINLISSFSYLKMIGNPLKIGDRFGMTMFNIWNSTITNLWCLKKSFIFKTRLKEESFFFVKEKSRLTINKSLSRWSPRGFLIRSSYSFISHITTCPLTQPPAITCGSVGENWKHWISSGASKYNYREK